MNKLAKLIFGCLMTVLVLFFLHIVNIARTFSDLNGTPVDEVSLITVSPDNRWKVKVFEKRWGFDRNFEIFLVDTRSGDDHLVFSSPDEPKYTDGQAILWARDSNAFILAGLHFYTNDNTLLYLLYDIESKASKCNATQTNLQGFTQEDLVNSYGFQAEDIEGALLSVQNKADDNARREQKRAGGTR